LSPLLMFPYSIGCIFSFLTPTLQRVNMTSLPKSYSASGKHYG
jgi:hypothetical protein